MRHWRNLSSFQALANHRKILRSNSFYAEFASFFLQIIRILANKPLLFVENTIKLTNSHRINEELIFKLFSQRFDSHVRSIWLLFEMQEIWANKEWNNDKNGQWTD